MNPVDKALEISQKDFYLSAILYSLIQFYKINPELFRELFDDIEDLRELGYYSDIKDNFEMLMSFFEDFVYNHIESNNFIFIKGKFDLRGKRKKQEYVKLLDDLTLWIDCLILNEQMKKEGKIK